MVVGATFAVGAGLSTATSGLTAVGAAVGLAVLTSSAGVFVGVDRLARRGTASPPVPLDRDGASVGDPLLAGFAVGADSLVAGWANSSVGFTVVGVLVDVVGVSVDSVA